MHKAPFDHNPVLNLQLWREARIRTRAMRLQALHSPVTQRYLLQLEARKFWRQYLCKKVVVLVAVLTAFGPTINDQWCLLRQPSPTRHMEAVYICDFANGALSLETLSLW